MTPVADPYAGMTRAKWICWWVAKQRQRMGGKEGIMRCLEIGRLRDPKETTGHSTLHIAANGGVRELVTVDANPETRAACLAVIPERLHSKLGFVDADAVDWLAEAVAVGVEPFDFIYLDGPNEAEACLAIFQLSYGLSRPGTLIMMDDTGETNKGILSIPWIKARPDLFAVEHEIPKDKTCHGMTVVRVLQ